MTSVAKKISPIMINTKSIKLKPPPVKSPPKVTVLMFVAGLSGELSRVEISTVGEMAKALFIKVIILC